MIQNAVPLQFATHGQAAVSDHVHHQVDRLLDNERQIDPFLKSTS